MDDFAAGAENENGEIKVYYELSSMMKLINLPLAKWATNAEQLDYMEGRGTERGGADAGPGGQLAH